MYGRVLEDVYGVGRLATLEPRPLHDDSAPVSAFANPAMAEGVTTRIDQALETPGARDLTAKGVPAFDYAALRAQAGGTPWLLNNGYSRQMALEAVASGAAAAMRSRLDPPPGTP